LDYRRDKGLQTEAAIITFAKKKDVSACTYLEVYKKISENL
jgi:hypothetical protein